MEEERVVTVLKGRLETYNELKNAVFINDATSRKAVIFINGLGGTIASPNYLERLNEYCLKRNICLMVPQFSSHPSFQTKLIDEDLENLNELLEYKKEDFDEIVLLGHSTGCQVNLLFIRECMLAKIKGVILQAPVSDVEGMEIMCPELHEYLKKAKENKFVEFEEQIYLSERFLSLYERNGREDLFSSWVEDKKFVEFGKIVPILSVISGADKYCFVSIENKLKQMGEVVKLESAGHSIKDKDGQMEFIEKVDAFLQKIFSDMK